MRFYRGIDYHLIFLDFPHMGVAGVIAANTDGSVNIYINTLYSHERQRRALRHELRHFAHNHLWCDTLTLTEKELEADNDADPEVSFASDFSYVDYYPSEPAA